jgi:hypothetical protein
MLKGLDEVERNLEKWYHDGIMRKAAQVMEEIAAILEGYAKTHHEWHPDTGATDVSTRGFIAEVTPKMITAVLSAGMSYDVFLELARDGKWAWLWPAIEENMDLIKRKLESIVQ